MAECVGYFVFGVNRHIKFIKSPSNYPLLLLGSIELCWLNFVRVKNVLIEANELMPSHLSKVHSTKSKTFLGEPFGQRLLAIFTSLLTFYVE